MSSGIRTLGYQVVATSPVLLTNGQQHHNHQQQLPVMSLKQQQPACSPTKLFYIDDSELQNHSPISTLANTTGNCDNLACSSSSSTSIPTTPAIMNSSKSSSAIDIGGGSIMKTSSSTRSIGEWTNPHNLATWIDNEVNSLVHDLEAKNGQLNIKSEKSAKKSKRRWLLVRRSRRNSSGAEST